MLLIPRGTKCKCQCTSKGYGELFPDETLLQTSLPMHHDVRFRLGLAVGEFPLTLLAENVILGRLFGWPRSGCHAWRADIWSLQLFNRLIPGKQHGAGEFGLLHITSSCRTSAILESIMYAKFPSTREYASRIKCPTSYEIQTETDVISGFSVSTRTKLKSPNTSIVYQNWKGSVHETIKISVCSRKGNGSTQRVQSKLLCSHFFSLRRSAMLSGLLRLIIVLKTTIQQRSQCKISYCNKRI